MYGSECWELDRFKKQKMNTAEMRIIHFTKKNKLRWLGREETETVRLVKGMFMEENRVRGIKKKGWFHIIESDMRWTNVSKGDAGDQVKWKYKARVADPEKLRKKTKEKKKTKKNVNFKNILLFFAFINDTRLLEIKMPPL